MKKKVTTKTTTEIVVCDWCLNKNEEASDTPMTLDKDKEIHVHQFPCSQEAALEAILSRQAVKNN